MRILLGVAPIAGGVGNIRPMVGGTPALETRPWRGG